MMTLLLNWCKALLVKMSSKQLGQSQRESETMYIDLRIIYRKVIITDENDEQWRKESRVPWDLEATRRSDENELFWKAREKVEGAEVVSSAHV